MTPPPSPPLPAEPAPDPRIRSVWGVALLWTLLVAALGTVGLSVRTDNYRAVVQTAAGVRLNAVKDTVTIAFSQWSALPRSLSHAPDVAEFLATDSHPDLSGLPEQEQLARFAAFTETAPVRRMNGLMENISRDFTLPFVALIDTRGRLVASTLNVGAPRQRIPLDLASREYFRQALAAGRGTQFLLGRVSGVPGMYFAHRVELQGRALGVAAVKQDADVINRLLADTEDNIIALTDESGVVVLGNRPELLLQHLPTAPAPETNQALAVYQRQIEPLPWQLRQVPIADRPATVARVDRQDHVVRTLPLPGLGLTAWVLAPLDLQASIRNTVLFGSSLIWLFGCALIWFVWRRLQLLEQTMQAQRQVGELSAARRLSEQRFSAVFEHASAGYVFFRQPAGINQCNPGALRMFGAASEAELLGRIVWFPPLSPELQADGQPSRERAAELADRHKLLHERMQSFEWRFCRLDGTPFDCEVAVTVIDWGGDPQFCAVLQDITQRKLAEAATREAQQAAEAASQTKSSFLANMSHELRTPMNAIIGMTHLALEDGLPAKQRDYVQKAHGAARSLLDILNDILDVSKIESGQLDLERVDFEIDAVVGEMADVLGLKAEEKGLELLFTAAPDLPRRLVGDPTRLRQVLVNLGGNAIKFTERGAVTVGMDMRSHDDQTVELHGWVRDTGVGLTEAQMERLFQPFVQADSSTTRRYGGTGLGLVICRQLVERMDGRIWVESEAGRGATFHFTVRLGRSVPRAAPRAWMLGELRGRRALLVDDSAAALEVLSRMLEDLGVTVDRADSGEQALELIARAPADGYAWMLIDWKMPGMDGVACARRIMERDPQSRPCVLLVTAFGREAALRAATGLPLAGVLQKPVTPSNLYDCLLLARSGGAALQAALQPAPFVVPVAESVRRRLAGARVLLVEDHPLNQELARELLQRAGMQVVLAENGADALARLADAGPFDVVLMDCQMPVMDGYTATRQLRTRPEWQALPVIAMTASALAEDRERALASGMNAHLTKPLSVELMLRTMAQWIVPRGAAAADEPAHAEPAWPAPGASRTIDTADGLARCLGKTDLYRRLLGGFEQTQRAFRSVLDDALARGGIDDAVRAVHDLKGLAGTIGAHRLQASAQALHAALAPLQQGQAAIGLEAALAHATDDLEAVLHDIALMLQAR